MQDKTILISSMNNLINHISLGSHNRKEMFSSLARHDFEKIFVYLDDPLLRLRMMTAQLLTELLFTSSELKKKFCALMGVHYQKGSNVILNRNLAKMFNKHPNRIKDILQLLKIYEPKPHSEVLFWFINLSKPNLTMQYMQKQEMAYIVKNLATGASFLNFDPLECIFGVHLQQADTLNSGSVQLAISEVKAQNQQITNKRYLQTTHCHKLESQGIPSQEKQNRYPYQPMNNNFIQINQNNYLANSKELQHCKQKEQYLMKQKAENRMSLQSGHTTYYRNKADVVPLTRRAQDQQQRIQQNTPRTKQKLMLSIHEPKTHRVQENTQRLSFDRGKESIVNKSKTIQLGRGRGCETERERRER